VHLWQIYCREKDLLYEQFVWFLSMWYTWKWSCQIWLFNYVKESINVV
jgi:hypothetical protein